MDPPPSYNTPEGTIAPPSSDSKEQPPSYTSSRSLLDVGPSTAQRPSSISSSSSSWSPLLAETTPTLTLDGTNIYSALHPSRPLYILSNPPAAADRNIYGLERVYYKSRPNEEGQEGEEQVKRSRQSHLYDISLDPNVMGSFARRALLTGQRSANSTYHKVSLAPGISTSHFTTASASSSSSSSSSSGSVPDLKVSPVLSDPKSKLAWKTEDGKLLATETKGVRDAKKKMVVQPRLEISGGEGMTEKDVDFLVAAWCARVWREAEKETRSPMSWDKCEVPSFKETAKATLRGLWF